MTGPKLVTRPPTGRVPYPCILVEGEEKAGKTWAAALLSKSDKVGTTYWLDLGEGSADEYGAIPGTRYQVLVHDGSYAQVLERVLAVRAEAERARAAGEFPVVLVVDTMTALWDGLKDWAADRAKATAKNRERLAKDPAAEVTITSNLWNDANARYRKVMTALLTFPGIVVMTARGKDVVEIRDGKPVEGSRLWKVEGQKNLGFDATVWVRLSRNAAPIVVGARSVYAGIVPGKDDPEPITVETDNLLEWLIFDALRVDPGNADVRDLNDLKGGDLLPEERTTVEGQTDPVWLADVTARIAASTKESELRGLFAEIKGQVEARKVADADARGLKATYDERFAAVQALAAQAAAGESSAA